MSNIQEFLLVGSIPKYVENFIKNRDLQPLNRLDDTTYIVQADTSFLTDRFTMVANLYTKGEVSSHDYILGLRDDKVKAAVWKWART